MTLIETLTFNGINDGPHVLFTARIHGNEPCGHIALERLRESIDSGSLVLKNGSLTLMPCCNPKAAMTNKRFIDVNLNRIFTDQLIADNTGKHEAALVQPIMEAIATADYYIDLHSFTEHMPPVVICLDDKNDKSKKLATDCGIARIWCYSEMMAKLVSGAAILYAKSIGVPAVLVECGQHDDRHAPEVAYRTVLNTLFHLGMIDSDLPATMTHEFVVVRSALRHEGGQKLIFPLMDKDVIIKGEAVFETDNGSILYADHGGLLFMRNCNTPVGEDYAYICDVYNDWP